jgi:hypothetical protein
MGKRRGSEGQGMGKYEENRKIEERRRREAEEGERKERDDVCFKVIWCLPRKE